jgi:hypothetical protein
VFHRKSANFFSYAERIHSGIRPHVCDYAGCGKQFIQRSALTVHQRVHTGEKPHMCERCGKVRIFETCSDEMGRSLTIFREQPFSDSSSLARHRRIHSGKRPYKCPYADCQKTFTRRTTLTRHQNHHTGTVEEAAAATAAALASRAGANRARSDADEYSEVGASPMPTPSPNDRNMSLSPAAGMPVVGNMHRQAAQDFGYMGAMNVPPHMRGHIQQASPRSSPLPQQYSNAAVNAGGRPSLTSNPSPYGPPPVLEPPTSTAQAGQNSNAGGSANASPHMGSVGWQSPQQPQGMPSPAPPEGYVYPEPQYGAAAAPNIYYPNSNIRRPHSTEPDQYDARQRMPNDMWAAPTVQ